MDALKVERINIKEGRDHLTDLLENVEGAYYNMLKARSEFTVSMCAILEENIFDYIEEALQGKVRYSVIPTQSRGIMLPGLIEHILGPRPLLNKQARTEQEQQANAEITRKYNESVNDITETVTSDPQIMCSHLIDPVIFKGAIKSATRQCMTRVLEKVPRDLKYITFFEPPQIDIEFRQADYPSLRVYTGFVKGVYERDKDSHNVCREREYAIEERPGPGTKHHHERQMMRDAYFPKVGRYKEEGR